MKGDDVSDETIPVVEKYTRTRTPYAIKCSDIRMELPWRDKLIVPAFVLGLAAVILAVIALLIP